MTFCGNTLLKELDRPEIIDWAVELKHRPEAYSFVQQKLRSGDMNVDQTRNALHALFRIGFQDHGDEILQTFLVFAEASEESVRSEAVQLAIGLVQWSAKWSRTRLSLGPDQVNKLRAGLAKGVSTKVQRLAEEFFAQN